MFNNIGLPEIILILAIAFIFFGPNFIKDLGKNLGQAVREFKNIDQEYKEVIEEIKNPPLKKTKKSAKKMKGGEEKK